MYSTEHKWAVKYLYRRMLRHQKEVCGYSPRKFDFCAWRTRQEFDKCAHMSDVLVIKAMMKDMEEALEAVVPFDPYLHCWNGPESTNMDRDYATDKDLCEWHEGIMHYGDGWLEYSMDDYYTNKMVDEIKARHEVMLQGQARVSNNYVQWLMIKKTTEEEIEWQTNQLMSTVNKTNWAMLWDWPYNFPLEYDRKKTYIANSGIKPNAAGNGAGHVHRTGDVISKAFPDLGKPQGKRAKADPQNLGIGQPKFPKTMPFPYAEVVFDTRPGEGKLRRKGEVPDNGYDEQ